VLSFDRFFAKETATDARLALVDWEVPGDTFLFAISAGIVENYHLMVAARAFRNNDHIFSLSAYQL
jgi:hypothetical protein